MSRKSSKESTSNLFNRYVWLVDTIYRAGKITYEEINAIWNRSELNADSEDIPLRTFHNHRKAIEQMFDINIECNKRNGYVYYIENSDDMQCGKVQSWLLNTFAVNNLIKESHKLKHRILFEQIPSGMQFLTPIIEAMREEKIIEMTYQNYWHNQTYTFEVKPYCIKMFRQRWYVVAYSDYYNELRIYSLDRVHSVKVLVRGFVMPNDFDGETYFANSFGISNCGKAEFVTVKVFCTRKKDQYFKSLPLHQSQEIIVQTEEYVIFRYYIQPTYDFRQELLSHGSEIEVLSPKWFRDEFANIFKEQANIYSK